MSVQEHKKEQMCINCMIVTVSDTRVRETDKSGHLIQQLLEEAGHQVVARVIVPDVKELIQKQIDKGCYDASVDVLLLNGGTGMASRDVTIESVKPMLEKEMIGFGEIFRILSFQEDIGSAAILSRAIAGTRKNRAIFAMPGSTGAVKLAMNRLILPELSHVVREIKKDSNKNGIGE